MSKRSDQRSLPLPSGVRIRLFGKFSVVQAGGALDLTPRGRKSRALLAILAVNRRPINRSDVAELLWSDRPTGQARASLRQALFELNDGLRPARYLVDATTSTLRLQGEDWHTDIGEVETCVDRTAAGPLASLIGDLGAEFLEGLDGTSPAFDDWLQAQRPKQRDFVLSAALQVLAGSSGPEARALVAALERFDPGNEQVARIGLSLDHCASDVAALHRRYYRLETVLAREFGARPSPETQLLFNELVAPPPLTGARPDLDAHRTDRVAEPTLVVLEFDGTPANHATDNFASGLSEEILHTVARIRGVRVIGRASSFSLTGADRSPANLMRQFGATHVLEGAVRRRDDGVRINAQLVELAGQSIIWSERFDRPLRNILEVQDEIAEAVAHALERRFETGGHRTEIDPFAYDQYLLGRRVAGATETRVQCIAHFEAVVGREPRFAEGWAALAMARGLAARWDPRFETFAELCRRTREAAEHALKLDPRSAVAELALAMLEPYGAYGTREAALRRALTVAPADGEAQRQMGEFAYSVGRVRDAFRFVARAFQTDPFNIITTLNHAMLLADIGLVPEAFDTYALARSRWPDVYWLVTSPWLVAASIGDWPTADAMSRLAEAMPRDTDFARFMVETVRNPDGPGLGRVRTLAEHGLGTVGFVSLSTLIFSYNVGLRDETFAWVDRSNFAQMFDADGRGPDTTDFRPGLIFGLTNQAMRLDPRFVRLCAKIGLCRYWVDTGQWPDCAADLDQAYGFRAKVLADTVADGHTAVSRQRGPASVRVHALADIPAFERN